MGACFPDPVGKAAFFLKPRRQGSANRLGWRSARCIVDRRQSLAWLSRRFCDFVRNHATEFHHVDLHYEHLVEVDGMAWELDTALRGASKRLAPILMTALVTGLGLLPLALGSGDPGREIEGPMATVILGGLVTSTLLNLLVLPTLALRYGRFEARQA